MNLKEFIEVTSIYDGKKAAIRAACIDSVVDNERVTESYTVDGFSMHTTVTKPACRTIHFGGAKFDCIEGYEEICDMIWKAEM